MMEYKVDLSIIVSVYNAEDYLRRCINSIIKQPYSNFELILVNDGSTDASLEICNEYVRIDNRIRIFSHDNRGVSYTRNVGVREARGRWITFVDSDDWIEHDVLTPVVNTLQEKNADLLICDYSLAYSDGRKRRVENNLNNAEALSSLYAKIVALKVSASVWGKFFRADVINRHEIGFEESLNFGEDAIFVFRYIDKIENFYRLGIVYYNYFQSPDSITRRTEDFEKLIQRNKNYLKIIQSLQLDMFAGALFTDLVLAIKYNFIYYDRLEALTYRKDLNKFPLVFKSGLSMERKIKLFFLFARLGLFIDLVDQAKGLVKKIR